MTEEFKKAIHEWLKNQDFNYKGQGIWIDEVLGFRQLDVDVPASYCGEGTCWDSEVHIRVYYIIGSYDHFMNGHADDFDFVGDYTQFIRDLTGTPDYLLD